MLGYDQGRIQLKFDRSSQVSGEIVASGSQGTYLKLNFNHIYGTSKSSVPGGKSPNNVVYAVDLGIIFDEGEVEYIFADLLQDMDN